MELRSACLNDLPSLSCLVEQLGYPSDQLKEFLSLYLSDPFMGIWVVEQEGRVAGCLAYHILRQFHGGKDLFRVVSLVVDERFRKRGVGRGLLEAAEREAKRRDCGAIELTSAAHRQRQGSHEFYRRQGYLDSGACGKCYFRKNLL